MSFLSRSIVKYDSSKLWTYFILTLKCYQLCHKIIVFTPLVGPLLEMSTFSFIWILSASFINIFFWCPKRKFVNWRPLWKKVTHDRVNNNSWHSIIVQSFSWWCSWRNTYTLQPISYSFRLRKITVKLLYKIAMTGNKYIVYYSCIHIRKL